MVFPLLASLLMAFYEAVKLLSLCNLAGPEDMNGKRNTERIKKKRTGGMTFRLSHIGKTSD